MVVYVEVIGVIDGIFGGIGSLIVKFDGVVGCIGVVIGKVFVVYFFIDFKFVLDCVVKNVKKELCILNDVVKVVCSDICVFSEKVLFILLSEEYVLF